MNLRAFHRTELVSSDLIIMCTNRKKKTKKKKKKKRKKTKTKKKKKKSETKLYINICHIKFRKIKLIISSYFWRKVICIC